MNEAILKTSDASAILCDASIAAQVGDEWFDPAHWQSGAVAGGRGAAWQVQTTAGAAVLRHYRRGGAVARLLGDRYFWNGPERSRPFAEFRLLQHLQFLKLPAPRPLAARYRRDGLFYRADLLTHLIPDALTLAELVRDDRLDAALLREVGTTVAAFHANGVWHADLNAHNVLLASGVVHLIDFDRGELRASHEDWPQQNLERLRRSLLKVGAAGEGEAHFDAALWQPLQESYTAARRVLDNGAAIAAERQS